MILAALHNERIVLKNVAESDPLAFSELFGHYRPRVYSYALHVLESEVQAEDVLQEVFLKIWINRHSLVNINSFSDWLHIITRNLVFDTLKKTAREANLFTTLNDQLSPAVNTTELALLDKENDALLQAAIKTLSPQQQQIYQLSRFRGMKHDEIAAQLRISPNTVKVHMVKALRTLRDYLYPHTEKAGILLVYFVLHSNK